MAGKATPLGTLIDSLWLKREEKRALEAQIKAIEGDIDNMEEQLLERMDREKVDKSAGKKAGATVTETVVPTTKDWDKFIEYVIKSKQGHLVERRPATLACREIWERKGSIPGLEPFTKRKVNIRTLS